MTDTPEQLAVRLLNDGQRCLSFFRNLSPLQWKQVVYVEHTPWQVSQLLAHFVSAEKANCRLVEDIISGGLGAPPDFDIDAFNEREVALMAEKSNEELMVDYMTARATTINLVQKMTASDLQKEGRHPFLGFALVEDILKLIYRHNQIHLREMRRRLEV